MKKIARQTPRIIGSTIALTTLTAVVLTLIFTQMVGCNKREVVEAPPQVILSTIKFTAIQSNNAFTGALELLPCQNNSSIYVGNYLNNAVTAITPSCIITKGVISSWGYPLLLPLGEYSIIYWGVASTASYSASRSMSAPLTIGADMSKAYWSMALNKDKQTYMPVLDQVMAVQTVQMGSTNISVDLARMVAGLNVVVKNNNDQPFDTSIESFEVRVGSIAEKINYTTGAPENQTKTVKFALSMDADRKTAQNATVMLYPSAESPSIVINIALSNGQTRTYTTRLKDAFQANTAQTVTILLGVILSTDPDGSTFTVEDWNETSQTIDIPILQ